MIEIGEVGDANGIFWVLVLFYVCGLESGLMGYNLFKIQNAKKDRPLFSRCFTNNFILFVVVSSLLLTTFVLYKYSGPYFLGIDRVTYWRTIVPSQLSFIPSLFQQTFYFVAFYYWIQKTDQHNLYFSSFLLLAYIFLTAAVLGQKFSAFIFYANIWLMLLISFRPDFRLGKSFFLGMFTFVLALFLGLFFTYVHEGKEALFILQRTALQSQLLWSVFNDKCVKLLPSSNWQYFFGGGPYTSGLDFIMFRYLPRDLYNFYSDGGTVLSGFNPALPILTFGFFVTLIFHFLFTFLFGILQSKLMTYIGKRNFIYSFILFKILISLNMLWLVANVSTLKGVAFMVFCLMVYSILPFRSSKCIV